MSRQEELARESWEKKGNYDEPRLSELVQMYEEIGFEVRLEPFRPEDESGCNECMKASRDKFRTVFVKRKA